MNRFVQIAFFALIVTLCHSQKIALKRFSELGYIGEISLGTPAQKINVWFDTNTAETMIISKKSISETAPESLIATAYSSSSSSSYTAIGTDIYIEYPFNSYIEGFLAQDLLQIAGFSIPNQVFVESIYQSNDLNYGSFMGIVGLNLDLDNLNGYSKPFANLFSSKKISNNLFSFWYNKNSSSPNQGELYLGGINPTLYTGPLSYTTLSQTKSWTIKVDSVSINGLNYNKNLQTLISTEYALIYGDYNTIGKITTKIGASYHSQYGYYIKQSRIASMPSLVFSMNGISFPLKPTEYVYNCKDSCDFGSCDKYCLVGLGTLDSPTWILGNIFIRTYYTVFDITNMKIGLAKAV